MSIKNKAFIISTIELPGNKQMAIDLYFLDKTITELNIPFTLRFYLWEGNSISVGYHQKNIPRHWQDLSDKGFLSIVKRPSGGGAVLHSGGITYALTFKKPEYKKFSYLFINKWLIKSFSKIGLILKSGTTKKSIIQNNCFGTSFTSDLIDDKGFKRIGNAQFWKKGSFLQHGEIQLNPPQDLWWEIFKEKVPPPVDISLDRHDIIEHLKTSFMRNYSDISSIEFLKYTEGDYNEKIFFK